MNNALYQNCKRGMLLSVILLIAGTTSSAFAQGTGFTYQGRLQDAGTNANGSYDFQFTLWDALSGGLQQPQPSLVTVTRSGVAVANGTFTVQLDFGANAFPGADRFLEIRVRPAGGSGFTILEPRQPVTSTPYSVRSASAGSADSAATATNASQLGGVAANQYVLTGDARLSDARPPMAGSSNYIQNTNFPAQFAFFNILGDGTIAGSLTVSSVSAREVLVQRPNGRLVFIGGGSTTGSELKFTNPGTAHFSIYNSGNSNLTFANTSAFLGVDIAGTPLMSITSGGNVGIGGVTAPTSKLQVNGQGRFSTVNIDSYVSGQNLSLCTASSGGNQNIVGLCSSSLRYKTNVQLFKKGLDIIERLRPIAFDWKEAGTHDVGLAAEDVETIEPLLTFRNDKGEIEGVKYNQLSAVFINSFKEQQAQIQQQQEQLKRQQEQIKRQEDQAKQQRASFARQQQQLDALKKLICRSHRRATACR
ncbi:MAG: tail fiber domain-containing protein [Acidobacteriota bacterium]